MSLPEFYGVRPLYRHRHSLFYNTIVTIASESYGVWPVKHGNIGRDDASLADLGDPAEAQLRVGTFLPSAAGSTRTAPWYARRAASGNSPFRSWSLIVCPLRRGG